LVGRLADLFAPRAFEHDGQPMRDHAQKAADHQTEHDCKHNLHAGWQAAKGDAEAGRDVAMKRAEGSF
jgi:hypothetical protein